MGYAASVRTPPVALACLMTLVACTTASPSPRLMVPEPARPDTAVAASEPPPPPVTTATLDAPERARPPSTASYEEALSTPEPVDMGDDHTHLTDVQLSSPMGGALVGCPVPTYAKVTIQTAVQYGRAVGATVNVRFEKPKWAQRSKPGATKAERTMIAKISACIDHNVRMIVWPPNRRRDSFTTEL
jgi:hypothetical protein